MHSAGSPDPDPAPAPPSAQDASVNTANAIAPTSSGTVSQSGGVAAQTGTIRSASGAPGVTATYVGLLYYDVNFVNEYVWILVVLLL